MYAARAAAQCPAQHGRRACLDLDTAWCRMLFRRCSQSHLFAAHRARKDAVNRHPVCLRSLPVEPRTHPLFCVESNERGICSARRVWGASGGLIAVTQTMTSKEGEFLAKELIDALIRNTSDSSVEGAARNILNAGMTAFTKKMGLGNVHGPKSAIVRLDRKGDPDEPDPLDGDALRMGAGVPMRLFTIPKIRSWRRWICSSTSIRILS